MLVLEISTEESLHCCIFLLIFLDGYNNLRILFLSWFKVPVYSDLKRLLLKAYVLTRFWVFPFVFGDHMLM